jgi:hypothetical protein
MPVIKDSFECIRTWEEDPFRLELYDTFQVRRGKSILAYRFFHNGVAVFEGDDFGPSPLHAIDSDETVAGLLAFLSLRPGDTDPDYFADYTEDQMTFALHYGEELSLYVEDLENPRRDDDERD